MKHFQGWFLPLFLFLPIAVFAQPETHYTVQVGTFVNAKAADFDAIRPLGMVYAQPLENNLSRVFLGGYSSRDRAQEMMSRLRQQGFNSAQVIEIAVDPNRTALVIQFETLNAKMRIDWSPYLQFKPVFALIQDDVIKLATGPYSDVEAARRELDRVRSAGFEDAFIKRVSTSLLQRVSTFETGIKQPLIPLNLTESPPAPAPQKAPAPAQAARTAAPQSYAGAPAAAGTTVKGGAAGAAPGDAPAIRSEIKRTSVTELQRVLQQERTYQSAIDGLYGPGTAQAYRQTLRQNRDLQKYRILAQNIKLPTTAAANDQLQTAIDRLGADTRSAAQLSQSREPLAMAYRAYQHFRSAGPGNEVNNLMNTAIKQAYAGKIAPEEAPFNYRATYAYQELDQLLLHLMYIHLAPPANYTIPCRLFEQHPVKARQAAVTARSHAGRPLPLQNCDPFLQWEEARLTVAIAYDLNGDERIKVEPLARAAQERADLYLASRPLDNRQAEELTEWNRQLWKRLDGWAAIDPLHDRLVTAFKVSYYQTLVRLEDFFLNKGFDLPQAQGLALATIRSMVGTHLQRFG